MSTDPTYEERILEALSQHQWYCGSWWYQQMMPTYAQRISLMRKEGYVFESRRCERHNHKGSVHEYRLVRAPSGRTDLRQTSWLSSA